MCAESISLPFPNYQRYGWKIASGPGVRLRSMINAGNTLILQGSSSLSCHPVRAGGQKVKVVLAAAMWNSPHMLVLDEPTNYLDRESLGALAAAIKEYGGGVVMISHHSGARAMQCLFPECMLEKIVRGLDSPPSSRVHFSPPSSGSTCV